MGRYQGWANYPTWCIALWLDNEEYLQREATRLAKRGSLSQAGDRFKNWLEDENPLAEKNGMYSDILGWALEQVNWIEIVKHFRED